MFLYISLSELILPLMKKSSYLAYLQSCFHLHSKLCKAPSYFDKSCCCFALPECQATRIKYLYCVMFVSQNTPKPQNLNRENLNFYCWIWPENNLIGIHNTKIVSQVFGEYFTYRNNSSREKRASSLSRILFEDRGFNVHFNV